MNTLNIRNYKFENEGDIGKVACEEIVRQKIEKLEDLHYPKIVININQVIKDFSKIDDVLKSALSESKELKCNKIVTKILLKSNILAWKVLDNTDHFVNPCIKVLKFHQETLESLEGNGNLLYPYDLTTSRDAEKKKFTSLLNKSNELRDLTMKAIVQNLKEQKVIPQLTQLHTTFVNLSRSWAFIRQHCKQLPLTIDQSEESNTFNLCQDSAFDWLLFGKINLTIKYTITKTANKIKNIIDTNLSVTKVEKKRKITNNGIK